MIDHLPTYCKRKNSKFLLYIQYNLYHHFLQYGYTDRQYIKEKNVVKRS